MPSNEEVLKQVQQIWQGTHPMFDREKILKYLEKLEQEAISLGISDFKKLSIKELEIKIALQKNLERGP